MTVTVFALTHHTKTGLTDIDAVILTGNEPANALFGEVESTASLTRGINHLQNAIGAVHRLKHVHHPEAYVSPIITVME